MGPCSGAMSVLSWRPARSQFTCGFMRIAGGWTGRGGKGARPLWDLWFQAALGGSPEEHPYEDAGVRVMEISAVSYGVSGLMPDGSGVLIVCHLLAHFSIHSLNPRFSGLHAGLAQCWVPRRCCEGNSPVAHGRKSSVVLGVQQSMVQGYREMAMSRLGF